MGRLIELIRQVFFMNFTFVVFSLFVTFLQAQTDGAWIPIVPYDGGSKSHVGEFRAEGTIKKHEVRYWHFTLEGLTGLDSTLFLRAYDYPLHGSMWLETDGDHRKTTYFPDQVELTYYQSLKWCRVEKQNYTLAVNNTKGKDYEVEISISVENTEGCESEYYIPLWVLGVIAGVVVNSLVFFTYYHNGCKGRPSSPEKAGQNPEFIQQELGSGQTVTGSQASKAPHGAASV